MGYLFGISICLGAFIYEGGGIFERLIMFAIGLLCLPLVNNIFDEHNYYSKYRIEGWKIIRIVLFALLFLLLGLFADKHI